MGIFTLKKNVMKKILVFVFIMFIYLVQYGQYESIDKPKKPANEYIYFGVKFGTLMNISKAPKQNNYVLLKTPYGDMLKTSAYPLTITPSAAFSVNIHFDGKNDRYGIVSGISIRRYAFMQTFKSDSSQVKYKLYRTFSSLGLSVPLYLKFNNLNIYRNQSYFTLGIVYNLFLLNYDRQKANWNSQIYRSLMPSSDVNSSSLGFTMGYNYKIYYFSVDYILKNFVNKRYQLQTEEGVVKPYDDLNFTNNLYFTIGINIPMTRWLTSRNWTAEQIRRFLAPKH